MFPWSCKARLQPRRLKWIQLYKEKKPIDDINCKANIVEFWFFTSRVTVVSHSCDGLEEALILTREIHTLSGQDKRPFFIYPFEKKRARTFERDSLQQRLWNTFLDKLNGSCVPPLRRKKIVRVWRVFAQIHHIRWQFYFYNHRAWS